MLGPVSSHAAAETRQVIASLGNQPTAAGHSGNHPPDLETLRAPPARLHQILIQGNLCDLDEHRLRFYNGEFGGWELDFFMVDDMGHVAMFSHAGWGPIARTVVDRYEQAFKVNDAVDELPAVTKVAEAPPEAGDWSDWLNRVERGLFTYDWWNTYGPYRRVARPLVPVLIDAVPSLLAHGDLPVVSRRLHAR
jgi:hypothetical protein